MLALYPAIHVHMYKPFSRPSFNKTLSQGLGAEPFSKGILLGHTLCQGLLPAFCKEHLLQGLIYALYQGLLRSFCKEHLLQGLICALSQGLLPSFCKEHLLQGLIHALYQGLLPFARVHALWQGLHPFARVSKLFTLWQGCLATASQG